MYTKYSKVYIIYKAIYDMVIQVHILRNNIDHWTEQEVIHCVEFVIVEIPVDQPHGAEKETCEDEKEPFILCHKFPNTHQTDQYASLHHNQSKPTATDRISNPETSRRP